VGVRIAIGAATAAAIVGVSSAASGAAGGAHVINVKPGPNAISKAIHAASSGDVLRIHAGTYNESVRIAKPLTLEAAPGPRPVIDAGCNANDAVDVTSAGVSIHGLAVKGAATGFGDYPAEIFFEDTRSGSVSDTRVVDSCDAEYGISILNTGPVRVAGNFAHGFDDSGIYVGSISNTRGRRLIVTHNRTVRNARGVIVEDSNASSVHITISDNVMNQNTLDNDEGLPSDGLFLTNSDHVRVLRNEADDNRGSGFHPNSTSDRNTFIDNVARGNGDRGLLDEGHGNCGSGNNFPLPHC
jgi:parallel beta-helix repeat protein